jgi:WD40 repeat protein
MACKFSEKRVVVHDLETGGQRVIEVEVPWKSTSSQHIIAVTTYQTGLHIFTIDGVLVQVVPDSTIAVCVAFHPRNNHVLAIGYADGAVRMWDVSIQVYVSEFKQHTNQVTNIRFAPDDRLYSSSFDETASVITLDDHFQIMSWAILKGHMHGSSTFSLSPHRTTASHVVMTRPSRCGTARLACVSAH